MPAASRQGDPCTGHGCFPPRPSTAGSPNVFINGLPALRVGDGFAAHVCGNASHASAVAGGSATVRVNGLALARIADDVACGSALAAGSPNVFAG